MEKISLAGEIRSKKGKSEARKLRKDGKIPAVLYGKDIEPLNFSVIEKEWIRILRHLKRNAIIELDLQKNGSTEKRTVMVKDMQVGFPRENTVHIDFLQVSMERVVEIEIPIHLVGEAKGVKAGGIVELHLRTLLAECLPGQIPEQIELDVSALEIGDSIHVQDVSMPGIKVLEAGDIAVVTVIPPTTGEQPVAAAEEGEAEKA